MVHSFSESMFIKGFMMELSVIDQKITSIKCDNLKWVRFAELLVNTAPPKSELFPPYGESCEACEWLYDHSDEIMELCMRLDVDDVACFHFDLIDEIEILRYELHEKYLEIFKTALLSSENSVVASLLNLLTPVRASEMQDMKKEFMVMQRLADEINKRLDHLYYSLSHYSREQIA